MRDNELRVGWSDDDLQNDARRIRIEFIIPNEALKILQNPPTNKHTYDVIDKHIRLALEELGIDVDYRCGTDYYSRTNPEHETRDGLARHVDSQWGVADYPLRELE